jgi:DNA-binding NarL/FixJ family response regulator
VNGPVNGPVPPPIRVLLVEDNDVYRETLEFLLPRYADIDVVGAVADGASAADACAELGAEVVVIDYRLPDMDGPAAGAGVRRRSPGAAVVILSASAGTEERESARIAAMELVRKDEGVEPLLQAIRAAAGREGRRAADD